MPIGYLWTVVSVALCTVFALWPVRRPWPVSTLSYYCGLVLNELPFIAFFWLLAATLLAVAQDDVDTPVGWVAFGLAVLTTVGLLAVTGRALLSGAAVEHALNQGLDTGWRRAIDTRLAAGLRHRIPWARILFGALWVRRRDVERVANLRYGDAGKRNLLDVYHHRSRPAAGPILVYLHGGRFVSGRKNREARPLLYHLASQGWLCVSANYRLQPAATFPDHLVDLKKVIAWVRSHGPGYGGNPEVLFVAGSSAGGHLASMAALTPNVADFQPGFEHADTSVTAAISLYGYYGSLDTDQPLPSSPHDYLGDHAPPFFITHGDLDPLVPVNSARHFTARLRAASSNPVVYAELPWAHHSFDLFHSIRFEHVINAIEAFAAWVRTRGHARHAEHT